MVTCRPWSFPSLPAVFLFCVSMPCSGEHANAVPPDSSTGRGFVLTAAADIQVYVRPGFDADSFGVLPAGESVVVEARTCRGWLGFDPGVAQGGNIGTLRLRWMNAAEAGVSDSVLEAVPVTWSPGARTTYAMLFSPVELHSEPRPDSEVILVLDAGSIAGVSGVADTGWFLLDTSDGNVGCFFEGWVDSTGVDLGGDPDTLPRIYDWNN